ncbi:MAG: lysophospholipid acyltransferase family protein, partial [Thermomicrobia bacterium]|nr:lysophospholipid acyltransferase family protein [Thermomicrobia bacterium]
PGLSAPSRPTALGLATEGGSRTAPTGMLLYWLVRGASALLSVIPVRLSYALAGAIGGAYCIVRPSHSRWAAYNLSRVLNEPATSPTVRKVARQSFGNYARVLVDFLRLPHVAHAEIMAQASVLDLDNLARAAAYGKGFILVTGHMGSWDRAGALLTGYGYTGTFLVDIFSPPELDAWVTRMRRKFRMNAIAVERPGALREMYRALQRQEVLVLLIDTPDPRGIPATFFGEQATFPAGLAQLALRTGCPVVVAGLFRRPDFVTYDGFTELIPPTLPGADADAAAQALTQRVVSILERAIVAHPAQWYMFRPMWPGK